MISVFKIRILCSITYSIKSSFIVFDVKYIELIKKITVYEVNWNTMHLNLFGLAKHFIKL